jgi:glycosyltransferase involved in cell wall biosynthesis
MKILLCHNFYQQESGENTVFRAESAILRRFGETVVEYTKDNRAIQRSQSLSIFLNGFFNHRTVREVGEIVHHERPDVALVQNVFPLISPSLYSILYRLEIPIVQLVYNYRFLCPNGHLFTNGQVCTRCLTGNMIHAVARRCFRKSRLQSAWYASILARRRNFLRRAIAAYIVPDEFMRNALSRGGFPAQKMFINSTPFDVPPILPTYIFEEYVLFVGRLVPQKGAAVLVRAMSLLQSPVRAIIVGEGEQQAELKRLASKTGDRISFTGPVYGEKMLALMQQALAVIIPSEWYDNAPLTLYHAFAQGKPVIASNIDGLPELVRDGENGLLFRPGDAAELAKKIDSLANDRLLASVMGHRARMKAEVELDAPIHYHRLRAVLDLCKKHE